MNMAEHVKRMQTSIAKRRKIYDACNARFSVNPFIFLWRTRYRAIYLFSQMGLWLQQHPKIDGYGATIRQWRESHINVGGFVSRSILALGTTQKHFTRAEIEVAVGSAAKPTAIKTVIRTGIELKLLKKCGADSYRLTHLCVEEAFDRVIFKMLTPSILEFCEYVVMWNQMQKTAQHVGELEQSGRLGGGNYRSLSEEIVRETYDGDIYGPGR
jgi:hypothetical protein